MSTELVAGRTVEDYGTRVQRLRVQGSRFKSRSLGHFQVGSYRYRSLIVGLYTL